MNLMRFHCLLFLSMSPLTSVKKLGENSCIIIVYNNQKVKIKVQNIFYF